MIFMTMNRMKKGHPAFNVPNYNTKNRKRVLPRWRKQRGIDSKKRIKKDFMGAEPTIGYKNPDSLQGVRFNGKRIMLVHNAEELKSMVNDGLHKQNDFTIAKGVSARKRIQITEAAKAANATVTNGAYK